MSYTLIGSQTSPFVRRIRMLLEEIPYEFKEINIFDATEGSNFNKINPVNQIPVLIHGEQKIWDSRQIFNYLNSIHKFETLSWDEENTLTAVDSMLSSGIALLMLKRSGMITSDPQMFVERQKNRIESVLDHLAPYMKDRALHDWNFITMSLFSFIDWASYREIVDFSGRTECLELLKIYRSKAIVIETEIPRI